MGSVVGCTKKLCTEINITEVNLEIKQSMGNIQTIYSNKKIKTKPVLNENENEKDNISNNDNDSQNNIQQEEKNNDIKEEEEDDEEKEEDEEEIKHYKKALSKIILIQKTFKKHKPSIIENGIMNKEINTAIKKSCTKFIKIKETENINKNITRNFERFHTINFSSSQGNDLKKNIIHKYELSKINPEKYKSGINGKKDDIEEIISVEQPFVPLPIKKSSKILINSKAIDVLKYSLIINNQKENSKQNFKIPRPSQKYLKILSDFGERTSSSFNRNEFQIKSHKSCNKLAFNIENKDNKEKKDSKIRRNHDSIKGNFMLKNEKVIRYQGGFVKKTKKKNGFGIVTWTDNSTLHGTYISSTINGIARFYNSRYRSTFIGEYSNNTPKGFGVYHIKSLSLQGYWENSNLNGIAIEVWDDGTYYQGEYENNKKNGIGLYRWPDGTIYQGEFNNGQMTGKGIIFNSDDSVFSGEMLNGYMNGYGIFSWGNGALYMGYYLQNIKHGFGIYIWDSKMFICYIGFWEMGKQQGIGAKVNGNKIKYCIWNKGKTATTLKGLYEIDRYLTGYQKGYYHFFTATYIAKLRANNYSTFNQKKE